MIDKLNKNHINIYNIGKNNYFNIYTWKSNYKNILFFSEFVTCV